MVSLDNLFDDENREVLRKMEEESGDLLQQMSNRNLQKGGLLEIRKPKAYQSPFMGKFGQALNENVITFSPTSIFPKTGQEPSGQDTVEYFVKTIPCKDGALVYTQYQSDKPAPHEMFLFYENESSEKSNLFGSFYIASIGDSFRGIIRNFLQSSKYSILSRDKKFEIKDYPTLTQYVNSDAYSAQGHKLDFNTTYNAIQREYQSKTTSGLIYGSLSSIDEMIASGLNWCADKMDRFYLKETLYIPGNSYNPLVQSIQGPGGKIVLKPASLDEFKDSEFMKDATAAAESAYNYIAEALAALGKVVMDHLPEPLRKLIIKLQQVIQSFNKAIAEIIDGVQQFIEKIIESVDEVIKLMIAFLCGIFNGIIGTIQAILRILAFLIDMAGTDKDYKSYLRRRDVGEKLESVLDFITESFTALMGAIKDLFTNSGNITLQDILDFLQSIGSFFQQGGEVVANFFTNTSRYKFAYWAGIFVFELIINLLLLFFTGGFGNVVKAASYAEKVASFAKIVGREAFSVATFYVVDILKLFRTLIAAFVKACARGLRGLFKLVEELIKGLKSQAKGERKILDELGSIGSLNKSFFENAGILLRDEIPLGSVFGQTEGHTCAANSLRMVLDDLGFIRSEKYLAEALETTKDGASILDIPKALDNAYVEGLQVIGRGGIKDKNITVGTLENFLKRGEKKAIVSVRTEEFGSHAVVVDKIESGRVFIRDPLPINQGSSYSVLLSDFKKVFNKKIVTIKK